VSFTVFWLFYFWIARLIFIIFQHKELVSYSTGILLATFYHGFSLDLSATCYFLILPLLLSLPTLFFPGRWYKKFIKIYSFFLIILCSAIILADAFIYSYWGFRIDFSVMEYAKTPKDAMASASTLQMIMFLVAVTSMSFLFILICNKLINILFASFGKVKHPVLTLIVFLILISSLIIPIRGGFGVAPLNTGSVYFSEKLFPNHAAINVIWNFGHSAVYSKPAENPYQFNDPDLAYSDVKYLTTDSLPPEKVIKTERPDILLIILESFGSQLIDNNPNDTVITPRFNEYIHEGIYFTNIYAAGSRTDKAVPAIFSGYPNLPTIQVIREPHKVESMPGVIKLLDSAGYRTSFWYGGDINFADLNSYLTTTGFRNKITMDNFDRKDYNSKWGVHDEILFDLLQDSLSKAKEPFAYAVLTLSSHEPFEVPMEPVFTGRDQLTLFKNSVFYTDKSLGAFLDKAKKSDWWKNTLVILIADHCRRNSEKIPVYSEDIFKIPMLWLGGALVNQNLKIEKLGSQFDLPLTLSNQLGLAGSFPFSKDLLSKGSKSFAFYTYNEGFAFLTDTSTAIYDIVLKASVVKKGSHSDLAEKLGKSFLQVLFDDYLKR
jgi:phosphoglycerol transferase MdoB-like AlkP superfamily enzyme